MSRLPIRLRLTLAFAVAMAVVLAAMALLVYVRVGGALLGSIDQTLRAQAREASAHVLGERGLVDPDLAGGRTLAQIVDARGRANRSTPPGLAQLLPAADGARAAGGAGVGGVETVLIPHLLANGASLLFRRRRRARLWRWPAR